MKKKSLPSPRVLIAEDDESLLDLLKMALTKKGYRVFAVQNGQEALAVARQVKPDVLIADIMMPFLNGLQLVHQLRLDYYDTPTPKTIFLTSRVQDQDVELGLKVGADVYITKPFQMDEVLENVKELVAMQRKERSPRRLPVRKR